jgi:hypothetical protein
MEFKQIKIEPVKINGTFLTRRELKKIFPSVFNSFKGQIVGALWSEEEKKLRVLIVNRDDNTLEVWTYEF